MCWILSKMNNILWGSCLRWGYCLVSTNKGAVLQWQGVDGCFCLAEGWGDCRYPRCSHTSLLQVSEFYSFLFRTHVLIWRPVKVVNCFHASWSTLQVEFGPVVQQSALLLEEMRVSQSNESDGHSYQIYKPRLEIQINVLLGPASTTQTKRNLRIHTELEDKLSHCHTSNVNSCKEENRCMSETHFCHLNTCHNVKGNQEESGALPFTQKQTPNNSQMWGSLGLWFLNIGI